MASAPETTVSFRCDAATWRRFRSLCDSRDVTPSQVLRALVRSHAPPEDVNLDLFDAPPPIPDPLQVIAPRPKKKARARA